MKKTVIITSSVLFLLFFHLSVFSCTMCMDGGRWDYKVKKDDKKDKEKKEIKKKESAKNLNKE